MPGIMQYMRIIIIINYSRSNTVAPCFNNDSKLQGAGERKFLKFDSTMHVLNGVVYVYPIV